MKEFDIFGERHRETDPADRLIEMIRRGDLDGVGVEVHRGHNADDELLRISRGENVDIDAIASLQGPDWKGTRNVLTAVRDYNLMRTTDLGLGYCFPIDENRPTPLIDVFGWKSHKNTYGMQGGVRRTTNLPRDDHDSALWIRERTEGMSRVGMLVGDAHRDNLVKEIGSTGVTVNDRRSSSWGWQEVEERVTQTEERAAYHSYFRLPRTIRQKFWGHK